METFKIAVFGDIVGEAGRIAFDKALEILKEEENIDFLIVNGENSAGGIGITPPIAEFFFNKGVHVITSGNHIFRHKEIVSYLKKQPYLLRPHNYPAGVPGKGVCMLEKLGLKIGVLNLCGRVFMDEGFDSPFAVAENALSYFSTEKADIILVDFHAEATSEKQALAYYLDGKVATLFGTHTHVQTSDARILSQGTAYITDIGFCGAEESILGMEKEGVLKKFLTSMPVRFQVPKKGALVANGIILDVDIERKKVVAIRRFDYRGLERRK